jgi:hypothetical protein
MTKLLAAALWYAGRGWPVLPCRPRGKEPLTPEGLRDATTDPETIRNWWARWPEANVGLLMGGRSGLLALDIDPRHGGTESLAELEAECGPLPHTIEAITGSGGRHILFRHPGGHIRSRAPMLDALPGIDLRADGSYLIVPPSVHPSGGRYTWEASSRPEATPLADVPEWLLDLLPRGENGHRAEPIPAVIREGHRNVILTSLAGSLRRRGLSAPVIEAALRAVNEAQCLPPLPDEEVRTIARSIGRYEPGAPPPELAPEDRSVGGPVEVCAAELAARPAAEIEYLPLLGAPGYIPKGWSVLVAGYPKAGKTELLARLCQSWMGERVLCITEEPASIWAARIRRLAGDWRHVQLRFALGMDPASLLARIQGGAETVVVVDTVWNLLGLQDEADNSEVARVLTPFVAAARAGGKTLVLLHHIRKGGGEHGEGIAGGHAFLGMVDVALEILREQNLGETKRRIRGWGRLFPIDEAVYELAPDGTMALLGSPKAVELGAVKARVLDVLSGEWQTRREILEGLEDPKPAMEQLRLALNALVQEGLAERDPAEERRGATYRYRLATKPELPPIRTPVVSQVGASPSPAPEGAEPDLPRASPMVVSEVEALAEPNLPRSPYTVVSQVGRHHYGQEPNLPRAGSMVVSQVGPRQAGDG